MKESVFYQDIVEEGVVKGQLQEARRMLVLVGEEKFGAPPGSRTQASIDAVNDLEQLEQLVRRTHHVGSWDELLADAAAPEPRRGRKKSNGKKAT